MPAQVATTALWVISTPCRCRLHEVECLIIMQGAGWFENLRRGAATGQAGWHWHLMSSIIRTASDVMGSQHGHHMYSCPEVDYSLAKLRMQECLPWGRQWCRKCTCRKQAATRQHQTKREAGSS